jgi:hypothetical protein
MFGKEKPMVEVINNKQLTQIDNISITMDNILLCYDIV